MPQNVWSAGRDEMLKTLALRDAEQRLEEDRLRRQQIDDENRQYRRDNMDLQNRQLQSIETDRTERRADADARVAQQKTDEQKKQDLIAIVIDDAADPKVRAQAGVMLDSMGVSAAALKPYLQPEKAEMTPVMRVNPRTGKMENLGDVAKGTHFVTEPAPPREREPRQPSANERDDPRLPRGTKVWIEEIAGRVPDVAQARAELSKGWRMQRDAHPLADLAEAADYLNKLYPADAFGQRSSISGVPKGEAEVVITVVDPGSGEERSGPASQMQKYIDAGAKVKGGQ